MQELELKGNQVEAFQSLFALLMVDFCGSDQKFQQLIQLVETEYNRLVLEPKKIIISQEKSRVSTFVTYSLSNLEKANYIHKKNGSLVLEKEGINLVNLIKNSSVKEDSEKNAILKKFASPYRNFKFSDFESCQKIILDVFKEYLNSSFLNVSFVTQNLERNKPVPLQPQIMNTVVSQSGGTEIEGQKDQGLQQNGDGNPEYNKQDTSVDDDLQALKTELSEEMVKLYTTTDPQSPSQSTTSEDSSKRQKITDVYQSLFYNSTPTAKSPNQGILPFSLTEILLFLGIVGRNNIKGLSFDQIEFKHIKLHNDQAAELKRLEYLSKFCEVVKLIQFFGEFDGKKHYKISELGAQQLKALLEKCIEISCNKDIEKSQHYDFNLPGKMASTITISDPEGSDHGQKKSYQFTLNNFFNIGGDCPFMIERSDINLLLEELLPEKSLSEQPGTFKR